MSANQSVHVISCFHEIFSCKHYKGKDMYFYVKCEYFNIILENDVLFEVLTFYFSYQ